MSSGGSNPWWIAVQLHANRAKTAQHCGDEHVFPAEQTELAPLFELGTPVVIEDGPFEGVRAIVLGLDARQILIVAVTLLRRTIAVELDPAWVRIENLDRIAPKPFAH